MKKAEAAGEIPECRELRRQVGLAAFPAIEKEDRQPPSSRVTGTDLDLARGSP